MAKLLLPRWIITNRCMSGGIRHSKKPKLVIPRVEGKAGDYTPETIPGVFENWEFRFWAMTSWPTGGGTPNLIAECRACGNTGSNDTQSRQHHTAVGGCCKRLVAAYKLLSRDEKCVICNNRTSKEKWGVLLCSNACCQAWCEAESQPAALSAALHLVGNI
jgi:hypothetical protein